MLYSSWMKRATNDFNPKDFLDRFNIKADAILHNFVQQIEAVSPNKIDMHKLKSVTASGKTLSEHEKSGSIVILMNGPRYARLENIYEGQRVLKSSTKGLIEAGFVAQEVNDGINVSLPQVTEEMRKNLFKEVKIMKEDAKQKINKLRTEIDKEVKLLTGVSEDLQRAAKNEIDKSKDNYQAKLDKEVTRKESELKA